MSIPHAIVPPVFSFTNEHFRERKARLLKEILFDEEDDPLPVGTIVTAQLMPPLDHWYLLYNGLCFETEAKKDVDFELTD